MINNIIEEINKYDKVLILGFGKEGKSTYNLIRKYLKDKPLTISDGNNKLLENNIELKEDKNLSFILGEKYLDTLDKYDLIIKSPGVNFKFIEYDNLKNKITSQIDLFLKFSTCKTIGITGTKGKSTTSSLIYHVLKGLNKKVILAGNIGIPVFEELDNIKEDTIFVIELSCHQLQFVKSSPNISILLNIFEEHLDLYKSYLDYKLAKLNIFKYQKDNDYNIWGLDSLDSKKHLIETNNTYTFSNDLNNIKKGILLGEDGLYLIDDNSKKLIYDKKRKRNLLGEHNLYNVAAALSVINILNLDINEACNLIDSFKPLEHRMEYVGMYKGIHFYNDSIATIPSATINCIESIPNTKTVIIGGMDRGLDLSLLTNYLLEDKKLKTLIFLKDTGYKIYEELKENNCDKNLIKATDMEDAVKNAYFYTKAGDACVLSPAAASYNVYKNFEERGKDYKYWIKEL